MRMIRCIMAMTVFGSGLVFAQAPFFGGQLDTRLGAQPAVAPAAAAPEPDRRSPEPRREPVQRKLDAGLFGGSLFQGQFAAESYKGFNPGYIVGPGDIVDLRLWGAVEYGLRLEVDSQGRIFVPRVGPVQIANVRNGDLNAVLGQKIKQVYKDNVGVYAALAASESVKVFVSGGVQSPGLYGAFASDSVLHFLDRAGGIAPRLGSFLDIQVLRGGRQAASFSVYDFLLSGKLPLFQFRDGDTIFVGPVKQMAKLSGRVRIEGLYEFEEQTTLGELLKMAQVIERATHVQIVRYTNPTRQAQYLQLADVGTLQTTILPGDEIVVVEDRQVGQIVASVEGEFSGLSQFVLPYNSSLADLIIRVESTPRSNLEGVQLFRRSIAERQAEVLEQMLQKLEQAVLSARSGTREEAELRTREADLILRFVERARKIEPRGQLVLHSGFDAEMVEVEDRDRLLIPRLSNTVAVQGEVYFPSAFVHQPGKGLGFYLEQAGGLSQNGSKDHVFVRKPNGELVTIKGSWFSRVTIEAGDEILVLPKVDAKKFQFSKDLIQIIYQIALSAGVILRI